jgi:hypothetical protein
MTIKNGQSRDTGNIGNIRHRTYNRQYINVKENRATIKNGQSGDTGNIGHTRHRTYNR